VLGDSLWLSYVIEPQSNHKDNSEYHKGKSKVIFNYLDNLN